MVSCTVIGSALSNTGPDGKNQRAAYKLILSMISFMTLSFLPSPHSPWGPQGVVMSSLIADLSTRVSGGMGKYC